MLTCGDILQAWELGEAQSAVERALSLLVCGYKEYSFAELAACSVGERDGLLLRLREQTFGAALRGFVECGACGETLVFSTTCAELRVAPPEGGFVAELVFEDWKLRLRPLDSHDLAAAAALGEVQAARQELLTRCLLSAEHAGAPVAAAALPEEVGERISAALAEREPQAEVLLTLRCQNPGCQHQWEALFDIATYLWTEVAAAARRLFYEVDALARVYGWREADILAMSAARRRQYLSMADS
jgi:hypothetical protein